MTFPTAVLNELESGNVLLVGLIRFDFGSGTYGFAKSSTPFEWNGLTYMPGSVIQVSDFLSGTGTTAQQFTIELAASPDIGLTPDVLQQIELEDYRDRPVTIYDAYLASDTGSLIHVEALRRGYIDQLRHEEGDEGYKLVAECETRALDYSRSNFRKRNSADQERRNSGDKFYLNAAMTGRQEYWWGREKGNWK